MGPYDIQTNPAFVLPDNTHHDLLVTDDVTLPSGLRCGIQCSFMYSPAWEHRFGEGQAELQSVFNVEVNGDWNNDNLYEQLDPQDREEVDKLSIQAALEWMEENATDLITPQDLIG